LQKAMAMSEGERKKQAIQKARGQALDAGVSIARVDRFINEPAFAKANTLRRVRAAGEKAVKAGRQPYQEPDIGEYDDGRPKISREEYAERAASSRAKGFTGMKGDGGLAELYQMQVDKADDVAPGTYTATGKGAKKIAPNERIYSRYLKLVRRGLMSPEEAGAKYQEDIDKKAAYDDPRAFDRARRKRAEAIAEAIRTGSPIPKEEAPPIGVGVYGRDKNKSSSSSYLGGGPPQVTAQVSL